MSVGNCLISEGPCVATVVGVSFLTVGLISVLVCGVFARMGKLPMAPIGARMMIAIPATIMIGYMGLVGATAVECCTRWWR